MDAIFSGHNQEHLKFIPKDLKNSNAFYLFFELIWKIQRSQKGRSMAGGDLLAEFQITSHRILPDPDNFII